MIGNRCIKNTKKYYCCEDISLIENYDKAINDLTEKYDCHHRLEIQGDKRFSVDDLKEMGLSERQISCIHYTLSTNFNFKKIAEELITSESTIKKEMHYLYKLFGVKNRELLRLLLFLFCCQIVSSLSCSISIKLYMALWRVMRTLILFRAVF